MDIFLIVVVVVMALVLLAGMVLLVIVYGHPDDKNTAKFPKFVTISGLWLAFASLLVLPYDVAANLDGGSGIRVDILWQIVYIAQAVYITFIIPFSFFFYESDMDDDVEAEGFMDTQAGEALKYTGAFAFCIILSMTLMWAYLNTAQVPVTRIAYGSNNSIVMASISTSQSMYFNTTLTGGNCPTLYCRTDKTTWDIPVSFPLYIIAFVGWLGWFVLTMFGGAGLAALPMDLINDFRTRPTPISTKKYFEERSNLGRRAQQLLELGKQLQRNTDRSERKWGERREDDRDFRGFEKHYYFLKKDYQLLYIAHKLKGGNPIIPFVKLVLGILGIFLSAAWVVHIIIFILPNKPLSPFLNTLFIKLSGINGFPLFGVLAFAIFSFYLLVCVVVGNFKLGVRFLIFTVYPMELGNTLMNAFLFNTWFILMGSLPTTQFCVYAFPYYSLNTQASIMFGTQIRFMKFFKYFYTNNAFIIALIIVAFLSLLVFLIRPNSKADAIEEKLKKLATTTSTSINDIHDL